MSIRKANLPIQIFSQIHSLSPPGCQLLRDSGSTHRSQKRSIVEIADRIQAEAIQDLGLNVFADSILTPYIRKSRFVFDPSQRRKPSTHQVC